MKGLSRLVDQFIVIIKEEEKLVIVAIGKLKWGKNCGFIINDGLDNHYFSSRFLKTRWKQHNYKRLPRNFLTLKKGCDTTKPPGRGGFEKRIRIKQTAKLK